MFYLTIELNNWTLNICNGYSTAYCMLVCYFYSTYFIIVSLLTDGYVVVVD